MPLPQAHAHNDYEHPRPLLDALDHGFCNIEADIFLVNGKLLVGHTPRDLRPARTLEALYLEPLRARVRANGGSVYPHGPRVTLLIDIKTDADPTYAVLRETLWHYADLFAGFRAGREVKPGPLLAVLTGNRPTLPLAEKPDRYAAIDGRLADLDAGMKPEVMPWLSESWTDHFQWKGDGPFTAGERAKLREITRRAHQHGYRVRFWASPDRPEVWAEQLAGGVDLLSVDDLAGLEKFLRERGSRK